MINHARTLLLNIDHMYANDGPGSEIIDPGFHPLALPPHLLNIRRVLFGAMPDYRMLDYRTRQLLTALHATEFAEYVTELDPRITYDLRDTSLFFAPDSSVELFNPGNNPNATATVIGKPPPPDHTGRSINAWTVTTGTTQCIVHRWGGDAATNDVTYTYGLSQQIPLHGVPNMFLQVSQVTSGTQTWTVNTFSRPRLGLADLHSLLKSLAGSTLLPLFYVGAPEGNEEPTKTFKNLWEDHPDVLYSLSGLLLAYIYQLEEVRCGRY